jgi:hypothetical protein
MTKDYFVVLYRDLEELNTAIRALARAAGNFNGYLRYCVQPAGQSAYQSVIDEPLVRAARDKRMQVR